MVDNEYLKISDTAVKYGVSTTTINTWVNEGYINEEDILVIGKTTLIRNGAIEKAGNKKLVMQYKGQASTTPFDLLLPDAQEELKEVKYSKLKEQADKTGTSYNTVLGWYKNGYIKGAKQIGNTIIAPENAVYESAINFNHGKIIDKTVNQELIGQLLEKFKQEDIQFRYSYDIKRNLITQAEDVYKWDYNNGNHKYEGNLKKTGLTVIAGKNEKDRYNFITNIIDTITVKSLSDCVDYGLDDYEHSEDNYDLHSYKRIASSSELEEYLDTCLEDMVRLNKLVKCIDTPVKSISHRSDLFDKQQDISELMKANTHYIFIHNFDKLLESLEGKDEYNRILDKVSLISRTGRFYDYHIVLTVSLNDSGIVSAKSLPASLRTTGEYYAVF